MEPTSFTIADHIIRWDGSHNWVLERPIVRTNRKTKEQYTDMELVGYYQSIHAAALRLFEEKLRSTGPQNVRGLATLIECAKLDIVKAITEGLEAIDRKILKIHDDGARNQAIENADKALGKNPRQPKVNKDTGEVKFGR